MFRPSCDRCAISSCGQSAGVLYWRGLYLLSAEQTKTHQMTQLQNHQRTETDGQGKWMGHGRGFRKLEWLRATRWAVNMKERQRTQPQRGSVQWKISWWFIIIGRIICPSYRLTNCHVGDRMECSASALLPPHLLVPRGMLLLGFLVSERNEAVIYSGSCICSIGLSKGMLLTEQVTVLGWLISVGACVSAEGGTRFFINRIYCVGIQGFLWDCTIGDLMELITAAHMSTV